jgi:hypothetical protein
MTMDAGGAWCHARTFASASTRAGHLAVYGELCRAA